MKRRKDLGIFEKLLVLDYQEDSNCNVEVYDTLESATCVCLKEGETEVTTNQLQIHLPMSLNPINSDQFKKCLLTALTLAAPTNLANINEYYSILVHPEFEFKKLSKEWRAAIKNLELQKTIHLNEISKNHMYLAPYPEFLGCFTWNLSRHGMFILADRLGVHVI